MAKKRTWYIWYFNCQCGGHRESRQNKDSPRRCRCGAEIADVSYEGKYRTISEQEAMKLADAQIAIKEQNEKNDIHV